MHAIKPDNMKDLLYEVLALLNKGIDSEDLIQRQTIANLNLLAPHDHSRITVRQAGEMAYRNSSFQTASYHLKCAISYFGISAWKHGLNDFISTLLILAYSRMWDAHLLLSNSTLAEGEYTAARTLVERTIPYVSHKPEDRAALLSVVAKSWIAQK